MTGQSLMSHYTKQFSGEGGSSMEEGGDREMMC